MKAIKVIIEGKQFDSIGDAAREYGNIPATTYSRLERGWDTERAVVTPVKCAVGSLLKISHMTSVNVYNNTHKKQIKVTSFVA